MSATKVLADMADSRFERHFVVHSVAPRAVRNFNNRSDFGLLSPKTRFATEFKLGDKKRKP